jgi:hypothetical protein
MGGNLMGCTSILPINHRICLVCLEMAAFGWIEQPKISRIIRLIYIVAKFSPNRDFTKHNGVTVRTFKHWKLRQKKTCNYVTTKQKQWLGFITFFP